jgi:hypothetical protein
MGSQRARGGFEASDTGTVLVQGFDQYNTG